MLDEDNKEEIDKNSARSRLLSFLEFGFFRKTAGNSHYRSKARDHFDDMAEFDQSQNLVFSIPVDHEGTTVFLKGWAHENSQKPPIILIHDLGETIALYTRCARLLNEAGYSVYGFDLRGHGRSGQMLGHVPSFESLINDLLQVVAWIRFQSDRKAPILLGQGLGGLIAVYFKRLYNQFVDSIILVAPILERDSLLRPWRKWLIRGLAQTFPQLRLPPALVPCFSPKLAASDSERRRLFHGISANFANELLESVEQVDDLFMGMTGPGLVVLPGPGTGLDFSSVEERLRQHPYAEQLQVIILEGIGLQPLTSTDEQLQQASDAVTTWLNGCYHPHDSTDNAK